MTGLEETETHKKFTSPDYNFVFDKVTGLFMRWGETMVDDPQCGPFPEILDIEVTTKCRGIPDKNGVFSPCPFCYKSNNTNGKNMSYDTFVEILEKFDSGLTQIAFGADADATANPDLFSMMAFSRIMGIIPNITVANVTSNIAARLAELCGAVAVSRYDNKDVCYDSVKRLTDAGMKQVNIHMLLSEETFSDALRTLSDMVSDNRLSELNAIVFLSLKTKGRGAVYTPLSLLKFKFIVVLCLENNISFGMDSCSASKFIKVIEDTKYEHLLPSVEPCEATCFSSYINVDGEFSPCSFADTGTGINVLEYDSFDEVWNHPDTKRFQKRLLNNNRSCPIFEV